MTEESIYNHLIIPNKVTDHMPPKVPASSRPSPFAADVLTLVTGTTVAQIIAIITSPLITRLYGPEAFGLLALFTSITSIIGVVACLRYEFAILLPESDEEAANIFCLCIIIVILISVISIPFLFVLQQPVILFLKTPQLSPFFWLIPLTIFISGTLLALNYLNTRSKNFQRLSIAQVANSCTAKGTQLGAGFAGIASGGVLIGAYILGQMASAFTLGIPILKDHLSFFKQKITQKGIIESFKRFSNFPKYDTWSALLNTISWQVPIFLLAYFFSTTVVGYYSLGMMMIQFPMSLIGGAIAQVFFQRASLARFGGTLGEIVEKVFKLLMILGIVPIFLLTIIGGDLFGIVFGSTWHEAGIYVQILSIWAFIWFISSPISTLWIVLENQKFGLKVNSLNFITRLISIYIGGIIGSVFIALLLFALSGIFVYGYMVFSLMNEAGVNWQRIKRILMTNCISALPGCGLILILEIIQIPAIYIIFLSILVLITYYGYKVKSDPDLVSLYNIYVKNNEI
ncbi:MAG: oligosaccharide flippase family protein [Methanomicrobiales archaeon]|jgi:O-antigen/teichoic acid export membrane protein